MIRPAYIAQGIEIAPRAHVAAGGPFSDPEWPQLWLATGSASYVAASQTLTFTGGIGYLEDTDLNGFAAAPGSSFSLSFIIDGSGAFSAGIPGNDLAASGTITGTPYSGALLTGNVLWAQYQDSVGANSDYMKIRCGITGGSLASDPGFSSHDIGLELTLLLTTTSANFSSNFSGSYSGFLGPIPR